MTKSWHWVAVAISALLWVLAAVPAAGSSEHEWSPRALYAAPVAPMRALALARLPGEPWHAGHRGIDVAAAVEQEVVASASGVVSFAGVVVDRPVITIRHDDGALSSVEPVEAVVEVGMLVSAGEVIGTVSPAPGHCWPEVCVHWGVRVNGNYIDPLDVLAGFGPVVLLPRTHGARRSGKRSVRLRQRHRYARGTHAVSLRPPSGFVRHATR